ncbi:MAG: hypothetical protein AVDCRST_MAG23-1570 [uncultured Sphingosinicella sp.]|uniref:Uncharacterized protein n=1 Tax=uncultured Sphingosinicella sp. TaxID=478748 RepID=A0A6J4U0L5_9SPHN|nr:hypothetical protein [uncultured Sphingosinicella sp.]CAA9537645.1 MAG: hypothetical protein AVDCRST_MAG23-1570 [uncultured Sphingosinicella sp.]
MPLRRRQTSTRTMLRAFQAIRGGAPDPAFLADLQYAQHKDLDLSIRIGALLAFDALLITAGINPLTASPGAPLSLDAPSQPLEALVIAVGMAVLAASSWLCVKAVLIGEEFSTEGIEENPTALAQRLLAAYIASVDAQTRLVEHAGRLTLAGGLITGLGCVWILLDKIF